MGKSVARLYTQFQPDHYEVQWDIDEAAMRFSGHVIIAGRKVGRPTQRLTFHANGLKVTSGKITFRDKKGISRDIAIKRINLQKTLHEVRLHTEEKIFPGSYTVELNFEAPISSTMTGIYPCNFKDGKLEKKLFATQFESHHAREAFPCIDEPEAKAVFQLTLITLEGVEVLSNTPVSDQRRVKNGSQKGHVELHTTFEPTPKMSTYLLAFVCGDLHKKSTKTKSGVEVNTWATTAQPAKSLDYALDIAKRSIEYFEDYFGVPYPLTKADHVALPDFSSGAMENWGLITYRERVMLAYPGHTSQSLQEVIALVIAHETSHQWFGNLVTMRWWDDLWLNESFANMMEYEATDAMFPEWHVWDTFVASDGLSALKRDSIAGVQSVRVDVHNPDEINSLFDPSIVYAKGGRLLNMLRHYIGEEAFRTGLTGYFQKHAYGNTTGDDLWVALSETSGKDVSSFMTPWLRRSGYPVLHVEKDNELVTISQEQFTEDRTKADPTRLWPVPLFPENGDLPQRLDGKETRVSIPAGAQPTINGAAYGHYIVDYRTPELLTHALASVKDSSRSEPGRLMLLSDNAMLAHAGYKSYAEVLAMLDAYSEETSEPVWDIISLVASEIRRFVDSSPDLEPRLKAFSASLVAQQLARLGWEEQPEESSADNKLRARMIGLSIYGEHPAVLKEAKKRFATYRKNGNTLPAELRGLIMLVPVQAGDDDAFDFLLTQHDTTTNSDLQADICSALTNTKQPKRAQQLLARLKDGNLVKPQDIETWLYYLLRNRYTRDTAWQWLVANWPWLEETFKTDKSYDYLPRYAAAAINTPAYAAKYHALFDDKVNQTALKRNIELGFEEISTRLAWLDRDRTAILEFFNKR